MQTFKYSLFRNDLLGLIPLNVLAEIKPQVPSEQKELHENSDLSAKLGMETLGEAW